MSQEIRFPFPFSFTVVSLDKSRAPFLKWARSFISLKLYYLRQNFPGKESVDSTTDHQANMWLLSGTFCLVLISFSYIQPENTIVKSVYSGHLSSSVFFYLLWGHHLAFLPGNYLLPFCFCSQNDFLTWLQAVGTRPRLGQLAYSILLAMGERAMNRQAHDPNQATEMQVWGFCWNCRERNELFLFGLLSWKFASLELLMAFFATLQGKPA